MNSPPPRPIPLPDWGSGICYLLLNPGLGDADYHAWRRAALLALLDSEARL